MFYGYVTYKKSDTQRFTDIITSYTTKHPITNLQIFKDMQHVRVHWENVHFLILSLILCQSQ